MIEAVEALKNSGRVTVDEDHDWGYQLRFVNEDEYCGKFMVLENNELGSFHNHKNKKETFIVIYGEVELFINISDKVWLIAGEQYTIQPNQHHMMSAIRVPSIVLEVSTHDDDSDTYRIGEIND